MLLGMAVLGLNVMKRNGRYTNEELWKATVAIDKLHAAVVGAGGVPSYLYLYDNTGTGYLYVTFQTDPA